MATWNNSSWYSEAILIQWNDTFYKPFGLIDKQRYATHARLSSILSLHSQLPRGLMDNELRFCSHIRGSNPDFGIYF